MNFPLGQVERKSAYYNGRKPLIQGCFCATLYPPIAGSSNGRTPPFEGGYWGLSPWPAAKCQI